MTTAATITIELQAAAGAVAFATSVMKRVQTQMPPGPPSEPAHVTLLGTISGSAAEIQQIANAIAKNGGNGQ